MDGATYKTAELERPHPGKALCAAGLSGHFN